MGYSTIVFTIYSLYKNIKKFLNKTENTNLKRSDFSIVVIISWTVAAGVIAYKVVMGYLYGLPELPEKSPEELRREAEEAEWEAKKKEIEDNKREEQEYQEALVKETAEWADSYAKTLAENQIKGLEQIEIMEKDLASEEEKAKQIVLENEIKKWEWDKQKSLNQQKEFELNEYKKSENTKIKALESWVKSEVSEAYEMKKKKAFDLIQSKDIELEKAMETLDLKEKELKEITKLRGSGPEVEKVTNEFKDIIRSIIALEREAEDLAEIKEKEFNEELDDLAKKDKWKF